MTECPPDVPVGATKVRIVCVLRVIRLSTFVGVKHDSLSG